MTAFPELASESDQDSRTATFTLPQKSSFRSEMDRIIDSLVGKVEGLGIGHREWEEKMRDTEAKVSLQCAGSNQRSAEPICTA